MAAKTLRELDPRVGIEILGEERHPYYPRPNLIEYLAGRLPGRGSSLFPKAGRQSSGSTSVSARPSRGSAATRERSRRRRARRPLRRPPPGDGARPLRPADRREPTRRASSSCGRSTTPMAILDRLESHPAGRRPRRRAARPRDRPGHPRPRGARSGSSNSSTGSCPASSTPPAAAILKGQIETAGHRRPARRGRPGDPRGGGRPGPAVRVRRRGRGGRRRHRRGDHARDRPGQGRRARRSTAASSSTTVCGRRPTGIFAAGDAAEHAGTDLRDHPGLVRTGPGRRPQHARPGHALRRDGALQHPQGRRALRDLGRERPRRRAGLRSPRPVRSRRRGSTRRSSSRRAGSSARSGWARRRGPRRSAVSSP